jgi:hypothetical protein
MDDFTKRKAIEKLAESRSALSDAYIAGFCKTAESYGVDPCELVKAAWTWGDVAAAPINAVAGAGNSLWSGVTGNGFKNGWRNGYNAADELQTMIGGGLSTLVDGDTWRDFGKNLSTGAAAMATGVGQGLAAVPGIVGGAVGAVGSGLSGNGWGNGWNAGRNFVDDIGVGNYNLGTLKSNLADFQRFNRDVYLDNNNIDVNNASALERAGLYGIGTAEAAGKVLGETLGFGAAGKLMNGGAKVVSNVAGKVLPRASGAAGAAANTAGTAANTAGAATRAARTAANTAGTAANTAGTAASATGTAANAAGAAANAASRAANVGKAVKTWGGRAFNAGVGVAAPIADGVNSTENYIHGTQDFINSTIRGYDESRNRDIDISTIL